MIKIVASDKVKMRGANRTGLIISDGERRLGMIGRIPGKGLRLFFERDEYKNYGQIKKILLAVAEAIPDKPRTAL